MLQRPWGCRLGLGGEGVGGDRVRSRKPCKLCWGPQTWLRAPGWDLLCANVSCSMGKRPRVSRTGVELIPFHDLVGHMLCFSAASIWSLIDVCFYQVKYCCIRMCMHAWSCLTLCDSMDCSPPGFPVYRILQARTLEWIAIPFSKRNFTTQGSNLSLLRWQVDSLSLSHLGSPLILLLVFSYPSNFLKIQGFG